MARGQANSIQVNSILTPPPPAHVYDNWPARNEHTNQRGNKNHDIHHRDEQRNYGQYIMLWDHILGSYRAYEERAAKRAPSPPRQQQQQQQQQQTTKASSLKAQ